MLAVAGCAAPGRPVVEAPLVYPPAARERMLRIALAEWEEWGRVTVDPLAREESTHLEAAPENFPRVMAYWRAVPEDEGAIRLNRELYRQWSPRLWREPAWSAAFVSFVMRSAGVDGREFPPSAAHGSYVDALIADAEQFPETAPFVPREVSEYAPVAGDLVCADRSARPLRSWRDRAADGGRFRPMHCDIVVAAGPGVVEAVGGNVRDAVTRARFPADDAGRLLPLPPGNPTWFAILENRLGRLPPWGAAPERSPTS